MTAVRAVGAYAPRFRITADAFEEAWGRFEAAGIEEKAVPGADEDPLTMGHEAAVRALAAAGLAGDGTAPTGATGTAPTDDPAGGAGTAPGDAIDWLGFAASRPPMAEEDLTARLGAMLDVDGTATRQSFANSTRAGTRAIFAAADAIESGAAERALAVAADAPAGDPDDAVDHAAGAGAAAFVLGTDGPAPIVDRAEYAAPYPGTRFRGTGADATGGLDVTGYDRRAFVETVGGAVDALAVDPDPGAAAIQAPDGKLPYRAASAAGVSTGAIRAGAVVHELGDLGAASVPVALVRALADGHESILAVSHGSGAGADALAIEAGDVPATLALAGDEPLSYAEYLRQRGVVTSGPPAGGGAYVSVPSWRRSLPQRYRLEAGRCPDCGALAFPPEGACPSCRSRAGFETVRLAGEGTVEAATTISQGGAPPEFSELQDRAGAYAAVVVAFEGPDGDTVSAPAMGTDAAPDEFGVGDRVEATIRRIYTQEGVTRYGFKVRPVDRE